LKELEMPSDDSTTYITHEAPVWRPVPAWIAMADLAPFGFPNMNEQMWLEQIDEQRYKVCCVPLRVYGIALGDHVELEGDRRFITRIVHHSRRRVLRIFFTNPRPPVIGADLRRGLVEAVESAGLLHEWQSDRYIAIDVPQDAEMRAVHASVAAEIDAGSAVWEWADAEAFRTTLPA
jgi:hypothetical protein